MEIERWHQIGNLFYSALEIEMSEREEFLKTSCEGDAELFQEVQSLLVAHEQPGSFMGNSAFGLGMQMLKDEQNKLQRSTLGHYKIIEPIGSGGMGEVFLAEDPRLGRRVAIKLLPRSFLEDPSRIYRFQQEARAASSISHPNIAHIYEIGVDAGYHFTSMEFIDGITLRRLMDQGTLELKEAVNIALQVGSALIAAHTSGIIHRDIKPENIMIHRDGHIKVLDFGLAKLTDRMSDHWNSTTIIDAVETQPGMVMGSPAYMSPEQARGLEVDARTDIWSLGIVLYEMVTGWTPFHGSTNMDVLAGVLKEEPTPLIEHIDNVPPGLEKVLKKMLSKDKDERYLSSSDMITDLKNLARSLQSNSDAILDYETRIPLRSNIRQFRSKQVPLTKALALSAILLIPVVLTGWWYSPWESIWRTKNDLANLESRIDDPIAYKELVEALAATGTRGHSKKVFQGSRLVQEYCDLTVAAYSDKDSLDDLSFQLMDHEVAEMLPELSELYARKDKQSILIKYLDKALRYDSILIIPYYDYRSILMLEESYQILKPDQRAGQVLDKVFEPLLKDDLRRRGLYFSGQQTEKKFGRLLLRALRAKLAIDKREKVIGELAQISADLNSLNKNLKDTLKDTRFVVEETRSIEEITEIIKLVLISSFARIGDYQTVDRLLNSFPRLDELDVDRRIEVLLTTIDANLTLGVTQKYLPRLKFAREELAQLEILLEPPATEARYSRFREARGLIANRVRAAIAAAYKEFGSDSNGRSQLISECKGLEYPLGEEAAWTLAMTGKVVRESFKSEDTYDLVKKAESVVVGLRTEAKDDLIPLIAEGYAANENWREARETANLTSNDNVRAKALSRILNVWATKSLTDVLF